jgi:hypothetical protein
MRYEAALMGYHPIPHARLTEAGFMTRQRNGLRVLLAFAFTAASVPAQANVFVPSDLPSQGFVQVLGAVERPGALLLRQAAVPVADALREAGGPNSDAYLLGAMLLRRAAPATRTAAPQSCVGLPELQALQTMRTAVPAFVARELAAAVYVRSLVRLPIRLDAAELGGGRTAEISLIDGDVLIIPPRPAYVQLNDVSGREDAVLYQPGMLAEEYFESAGYRRRGMFGKDWAVLPNGEVRELRLRFWNYRPTAIPPGATLVSGISGPQACMITRNRPGA